MADSPLTVDSAKGAIRAMLEETPRPTQKRIAAGTGLTQSYVAKICRCEFGKVNAGVEAVAGYARLTLTERKVAEDRTGALAGRIVASAGRLAARDPGLADAIAAFLDKVAERP